MIIKNASVFQEDGTFKTQDIYVEGDKIAESGSGDVIDATGLIAIPGLTDIHFHGCMRHDFCDGTTEAIQTLADYELSCVQGRPAAGVFRRAAGGGDRLGSGVRQPDRTHFFRILEIRQGNPGLCAAARKKIFRICKNFICICEKMGYNKVESSSGKTAKTKR